VDVAVSGRPGRAVSVRLYALSRVVGTASSVRGVAGEVVFYGGATGAAQTLRDLLGDGESMAKYASAGPSLVRSEFPLSPSWEALAALIDDLLSTSPRERVA
jgi:hypothetical protein